tara:strand:- start:4366 stop:4572 length:207 start_codon:yes stop_codon:yes gene_type:complete
MELIIQIISWAAIISIGLWVLFSPKSDGRTKTGNKDNAADAPGCLLGFGLIAGLIAGILVWITGISPF